MKTRSIDFTLAFPQADVKTAIFLHSLPGVELDADKNKYVLKLLKNVYGLKDAGRTWWDHLTYNLGQLQFKPSGIDPCVFICGQNILVCYVDDCLIFSPNAEEDEKCFNDISSKFEITDETMATQTVKTYLDFKVDNYSDRSFRIS